MDALFFVLAIGQAFAAWAVQIVASNWALLLAVVVVYGVITRANHRQLFRTLR